MGWKAIFIGWDLFFICMTIALAAWVMYPSSDAQSVLRAPPLVVMEPGEEHYRVVMPSESDNGRRIFIQGISLAPTWDQSEGLESVAEAVIFPAEFTGRIEVMIRHVPTEKEK